MGDGSEPEMLEAIRSDGAKPPFFIVHGLHGFVPMLPAMEKFIDRDRPIYALHARGIVGAEPPHERVEDMIGEYLAQIRAARPSGPYVLSGMCAGGLIAMELARALTAAGEDVGPVTLVDPPLVPHSESALNRAADPKNDPVLYQHAYADVEQMLQKFAARFVLPFDMSDPAQLRQAIEVGIATHVAFYRYVPPRYDGPTEFIISADRAFGHFHPMSPWRKIVARPGRFYVVPGKHEELFLNRLDDVSRLLRFAVNPDVDF